MSVTTSHRPASATRSIRPFTTSWIVSCRRDVARGVNALETNLRSRTCGAPSRPRRLLASLSYNGPDVMPCAARVTPGGRRNLLSRNISRARLWSGSRAEGPDGDGRDCASRTSLEMSCGVASRPYVKVGRPASKTLGAVLLTFIETSRVLDRPRVDAFRTFSSRAYDHYSRSSTI